MALYANGEEGALYYFTEDFAGLYQDDWGTTPVTAVGQPVGLMLDRRFGLARGPELNPDVDIDNPDAWSLGDGWSIVDGALVANMPTGNAIVIGTAPEVGKTYEITFEVVEYTSGSVRIGGGTGSGLTRTGAGVFSEIRTAAGSTTFRFLSAGSPVLKIGRFSIREIPGNHASQPTTTARPLLQRGGDGELRMAGDGVDDAIAAALDTPFNAAVGVTIVCAYEHDFFSSGAATNIVDVSGNNPFEGTTVYARLGQRPDHVDGRAGSALMRHGSALTPAIPTASIPYNIPTGTPHIAATVVKGNTIEHHDYRGGFASAVYEGDASFTAHSINMLSPAVGAKRIRKAVVIMRSLSESELAAVFRWMAAGEGELA